MQDIKAAAERWRNHRYTNNAELDSDAADLADHAAREWDSRPIDESWLRSVGFAGAGNPMRFNHPDRDLGELRAIAATKFYDGIEIWQEHVGCLILFSNNQLTRGEMVRLFSGLGIQLSGGGE